MVNRKQKLKGKGFMDIFKNIMDVGKTIADSGAIGHALNAGKHIASSLGHENVAKHLGNAHGHAKKFGLGRKKKIKGSGNDSEVEEEYRDENKPQKVVGAGRKRRKVGSGMFGDLGASMGLPDMLNFAKMLGMGRKRKPKAMKGNGFKMPGDDIMAQTQNGMNNAKSVIEGIPQVLEFSKMFGLGKRKAGRGLKLAGTGELNGGALKLAGTGERLAGGALGMAGGSAYGLTNYSMPQSTPMYNSKAHINVINPSAVRQGGRGVGINETVRRGQGKMYM
jgi:hypothetical protein